eukprot:TRINITY_DN23026_c0_g1_i1.p1 TRINITY_DN23026_c0_g1~~TRINITY_DN23026_c0_g1_i1.p1  ORF type:complete len:221 (+),score=37.85 TRINITY_DN23026_c0_g1_i1:50-712(+)
MGSLIAKEEAVPARGPQHALRKQKSQEAANLCKSQKPNKTIGVAKFDLLGDVQIIHLGTETVQRVIHAMTTEGCETRPAGESSFWKICIKTTSAGAGRKAQAESEAEEIDDLMYIKETISLCKASGAYVGSEHVNNSDDGMVDVWDGEELHMRIDADHDSNLESLSGGDYMLVLKRETKRFPDEEIEQKFIAGEVDYTVMEEANKKAVIVQEWHAPITMP